jgi:hypothetical protein
MISAEFVIFLTSFLIATCAAGAISVHFAIKRLERMHALYMNTIGALVYAVAEARGDFEDDDPTDEEEMKPKLEEAKVLQFRSGSEGDSDDGKTE